MREDHVCPACDEARDEREGTGIWTCAACGHTFAGGAYQPETPGGQTVQRSIRAALSEDEDVEIDTAVDIDEQ
jgi:large subunit ribosomal protein L37Ae